MDEDVIGLVLLEDEEVDVVGYDVIVDELVIGVDVDDDVIGLALVEVVELVDV